MDNKLQFWLDNNLNVLFSGYHGVGKTTIAKDIFEKNNLKYVYMSASTLDPWVDVVGLPREKQTPSGKVIEFIRPEHFPMDVEAVFIDELNRAHSRILNAIMELIQFKSINGKKFPKLKVVWAAVNPWIPEKDDLDEMENDEEDVYYTVNRLDEAVKDRFHIFCQMSNLPDEKYFTDKYGLNGQVLLAWYNKNIKNNKKWFISPRRLEYAMDIYLKGGSLSDVLDSKYNPQSLENNLIVSSELSPLIQLHKKDFNKFNESLEEIKKQPSKMQKISSMIQDSKFTKGLKIPKKFVDAVLDSLLSEEEKYAISQLEKITTKGDSNISFLVEIGMGKELFWWRSDANNLMNIDACYALEQIYLQNIYKKYEEIAKICIPDSESGAIKYKSAFNTSSIKAFFHKTRFNGITNSYKIIAILLILNNLLYYHLKDEISIYSYIHKDSFDTMQLAFERDQWKKEINSMFNNGDLESIPF